MVRDALTGEPIVVECLGATATRAHRPVLAALLKDSVDGGASVGFLPPLDDDDARRYWESVCAIIENGSRRLWVARETSGAVTGTVQLDLEARPNGSHRAEVMKLMVHSRRRRRGIGRALMRAAEDEARRLGRTTLVLDTRHGDPSELLYRSLGWECAGVIPRYARSAGGALDPTAFYYKLLDPS
ncbi:MAG TPA: GNAT family N-acetyltransferase [Candidatus Methylomirabilis sp.]|nr:GNAT family N-acetyltransferase [Candidatus Methylomirabilis sp.]